ncbi:hypothetical protein ACES2L_02355 [Bdellovibrio bacteriovorus]
MGILKVSVISLLRVAVPVAATFTFAVSEAEICIEQCRGAANEQNCVMQCQGITPLPMTGPIPPPRPADLGSSTQGRSSGNGGNRSQEGSSNQQRQSGANMAQQCQADYQNYYDNCSKEIDSTSYSCDEKNDAGMTGVADQASQLALMLGQQTGSNVQAACGQMANISQAANAAVAAYRINCSSAISTCKSTCKLIEEYVRGNPSCGPYFLGPNSSTVAALANAQNLAKSCNNFDAKMNQAQQAIQNYGNTAANASQCENLTKGDPATATPDFCKANPTAPNCVEQAAVDCTNPSIATTNKVCVCAKNPMDPMCFNQQSSSGVTSFAGGGIDSSSRLNSSTGNSDMSFAGDIPSLPSIDQAAFSSSGPDDAVDGKQGSGAGVGGFTGGGSGSSMAGAGGGSDGANRKLAEAYAGGGGFYGGGGGFKSGASGGGYAGAVPGAPPGSAGSDLNKNGQPDLRQFLPGGKFDPRLMSGGAGRDGITGPSSDIWQKIQNRYRVLSPTLMP